MSNSRRNPATEFRDACIDDRVGSELQRLRRSDLLGDAIVIGTLALNFYVTPRYTDTIELLFHSQDDLDVRLSGEQYLTLHSGVEVRLLSPDAIGLTADIAAMVFATAEARDGMRIASREGMIALRLFAAGDHRGFYAAAADVQALLEDNDAALDAWELHVEHYRLLELCRSRAQMPKNDQAEGDTL